MASEDYEDDRDHLSGRNRAALLSREEVRNIHVKLAVLSEKLDRVLEDRARVAALEDKVAELELALAAWQARVTVWGVVAGAVWSLGLTLVGMGVFWK